MKPKSEIDSEGKSFVLRFESHEDLSRAQSILESWDSQISTLQECAQYSMLNGVALQKYGGFDIIEGRIRESVGMAMHEHAVLMLMETREGSMESMAAMSDHLESRVLKIFRSKMEPKEYADFIEGNPPRNPDEIRAASEVRIIEIQAYVDELDAEARDYQYEMRAANHDMEQERRIVAIADDVTAARIKELDETNGHKATQAKKEIAEIEAMMATLVNGNRHDHFEWNQWNYHLGVQQRILKAAQA